jgi:hypothetical protein
MSLFIQIRVNLSRATKLEVSSNGICQITFALMNWYFNPRLSSVIPSTQSSSQTPAGDVPIRSVTLALAGTCLVAGNNKVFLEFFRSWWFHED